MNKRLGQVHEGFDFDDDLDYEDVISNQIEISKNREKIIKFLEFYGVTNFTIGPSGIDVDGDVDLSSNHLKVIPFKFNRVNGNFNVSFNELTSLNNSPNYVGGNFNCNYNFIRSFNGAPKVIMGKFRGEKQKYGSAPKLDNQFYIEWKESSANESIDEKFSKKVRLLEAREMFGTLESISSDKKTCSIILESGQLLTQIPTDKVELIGI